MTFTRHKVKNVPWKRPTRGMPRERKYANDRASKLRDIKEKGKLE